MCSRVCVMDADGSRKQCSRCGELKDVSEFSFKNEARGWLHGFCRGCHKKWNRAHYERNRATYIANAHRNSAVYHTDNVRHVIDYLLGHPCVDCGEQDLIVLEFDHRDPSIKRMDVSNLLRYSSWSAIEAEIAKCDVRCANCHRRKTARERDRPKVAFSLMAQTLSGQGRQGSNLQTFRFGDGRSAS